MGLFLGLAVKSRVPICHLLEPLQAPAGPMQNVTTGSVFCTIKLLFPKPVPYILQLLEQSGHVSGTTTVTSGFHTFNIHSSHSCHYSKVQNPVTHNAQSCTRNIKFSCQQQKSVCPSTVSSPISTLFLHSCPLPLRGDWPVLLLFVCLKLLCILN